MSEHVVNFEDFTRLLGELQARDGEGIDSVAWCERNGIDPDALHQVVTGMIENAQEMFEVGLSAYIDSRIEEGEAIEGTTEDGHKLAMVPFDMGMIVGMVSFNSFAIAWEAALQYGPARIALPEEVS